MYLLYTASAERMPYHKHQFIINDQNNVKGFMTKNVDKNE